MWWRIALSQMPAWSFHLCLPAAHGVGSPGELSLGQVEKWSLWATNGDVHGRKSRTWNWWRAAVPPYHLTFSSLEPGSRENLQQLGCDGDQGTAASLPVLWGCPQVLQAWNSGDHNKPTGGSWGNTLPLQPLLELSFSSWEQDFSGKTSLGWSTKKDPAFNLCLGFCFPFRKWCTWNWNY